MVLKPKTYFEQIPVELVKKIAQVYATKETALFKKPNTTAENRGLQMPRAPLPEVLQLMEAPLDIFQVELDGSVLWQGSAASIDEARQRVKELKADSAAQYMALNLRTGSKLVINPDGSDVPGGQELDAAQPESS